ncbi:MAG: hypothetical protein APR54_04385 [Candidatus Cloacimonas sp. SDB]|nr:MAG: hypothetical protein APR54_04385 [Candidatus Cloacimonas sp. SDB]
MNSKLKLKISATVPNSFFLIMLILSCNHNNDVDISTQIETFHLTKQLVIDGNINDSNLFSPVNIVVDKENKIFLADPYTMEIKVFTTEGDYLFDFGGKGESPGKFTFLFYNFAIDTNNLIYFINNENKIEIFDNNGSYIKTIKPNVLSIFDISAYDSLNIYINQTTTLNGNNKNVILKINSSGEIIDSFGYVNTDLTDFEIWKAKHYRSCAIDIDNEGFIYYSSIADYNIFKFNQNGNLIYSIKGDIPFDVEFEDHTIIPVVWDLCVSEKYLYVLWGQEGQNNGNRVDVYNKNTGDLIGYFHTQLPTDERNPFIEIINDDIFYTCSFDSCKLYQFKIIWD